MSAPPPRPKRTSMGVSTTAPSSQRLIGRDNNSDEGNDHDDQEQDDETRWSAEMLRTAARNIARKKTLSSLSAYEVRLAHRELVDLITKATERCFNVLSEETKAALRASASHTQDTAAKQFQVLQSELTRILSLTEQWEAESKLLSAAICDVWTRVERDFARPTARPRGFCYSPLDMLDVVVLGGGSGAANSDVVIDAVRVIHRAWSKYKSPTEQNDDDEDQDQQGNGGDGESKLKKTAAATPDDDDDFADEMELQAEWMAIMNEMQIPSEVQGQLLELCRNLPSNIRRLRLAISVERGRLALPLRARLVERIKHFGAELGPLPPVRKVGDSENGNSNMPRFGEGPPPELFDLAEEHVAKIKAFELASGLPLFVDVPTARAARLCERDVSSIGAIHVTPVVVRIVKSMQQQH